MRMNVTQFNGLVVIPDWFAVVGLGSGLLSVEA
jgi:hypothetical protein